MILKTHKTWKTKGMKKIGERSGYTYKKELKKERRRFGIT